MLTNPILVQLSFANFRNLKQGALTFGEGLHLIAGKNGMGKTNLLDAIFYLCLTRSHFRYGDAASITKGEKWFRIAGHFDFDHKREKFVLKFQNRKGKIIERNGSAIASLVDHIGLLSAVMISPSDIELVIGGPEERRRFLDQTISQYNPTYLKALISYNRLLKLRNAHLKSADHPLELDLTLLSTYDQQLLQPVQIIYEARKAFVDAIRDDFRDLYTEISGGQEPASLEYQSKLSERPYAELLMKYRDQDLFMKRTNAGPHRDEIELLIKDASLRKYASQGQLKTFLLALRLAQARVLSKYNEKKPILLLDDLFDRLDANRVQQLISLIDTEGYKQVFVTDTHPERLRDLKVENLSPRYYSVNEGEIKAV